MSAKSSIRLVGIVGWLKLKILNIREVVNAPWGTLVLIGFSEEIDEPYHIEKNRSSRYDLNRNQNYKTWK